MKHITLEKTLRLVITIVIAASSYSLSAKAPKDSISTHGYRGIVEASYRF